MDMSDECWFCAERGTVAHNIGISCNNQDPNMTGDERAIKKGWFDYPRKFEPCWKTKLCANFRVGVGTGQHDEQQEYD